MESCHPVCFGRSALTTSDHGVRTGRTDAPTDTSVGEQGIYAPAALVLTVLYHSDPSRIGHQCAVPWQVGVPLIVNRLEPVFSGVDGSAGPLAEPGVSRRPLSLEPDERGLRVRAEGELPYRLAGRPLSGTVRLPAALLDEGTLLRCGRGVMLWIEARALMPSGVAVAGLDGVSGLAEQVRARVHQLSDLGLPVMITGEADTGRQRIARALHATGPEPAGPWVVVAADRWDADGVRRDCERARGGTLLLEGVERLPASAQDALIRILTEQEDAGGASRVRFISTTSTDPGTLVEQARLLKPLAYRLCTTRIAVAPLRERPADVPLYFVSALRARLAELGARERLTSAEGGRSWLPRPLVEGLLRHGWPGNRRELENLAQEVALASRQGAHATLPAYWQPRPAPGSLFVDPVAAVHPSAVALDAPDDRQWAVPPDDLRAALKHHGWRVRAVAVELGVARNTVYSMMARLGIRRPSDLTAADILAAVQAEGSNDPGRVAERLEVSERGLKLRLHALDLTLE